MKQPNVRAAFGLTAVLPMQLAVMHAQVVNGTILGAVRDSSGTVIPQVNVSARNLETGAVRSALTDTSPAEQYNVEAGVSGFRTSINKGISVTVGASVIVDFELAVGEVQQRVGSGSCAAAGGNDQRCHGWVGGRERRTRASPQRSRLAATGDAATGSGRLDWTAILRWVFEFKSGPRQRTITRDFR